MKKRLGVNIDHVATLRNARGEKHPDPYTVALDVLKAGADSITVHLREDRRHINDMDLKNLSSNKSIPVNLEIASNPKIVNIALKNKPSFICLVPEKRNEVTTEGGLNLKKNKNKIKKILEIFNRNNIRTSLFINPSLKDIFFIIRPHPREWLKRKDNEYSENYYHLKRIFDQVKRNKSGDISFLSNFLDFNKSPSQTLSKDSKNISKEIWGLSVIVILMILGIGIISGILAPNNIIGVLVTSLFQWIVVMISASLMTTLYGHIIERRPIN